MRHTLPMWLFLAAAACSRSGGTGTVPEVVLASAILGPPGGVLAVDSGPWTGLRLSVPPGALAEVVELQFLGATQLPAGLAATSIEPQPGPPFIIRPADVDFKVLATLRSPYDTGRVAGTAPGNVRFRQWRNGNRIEIDPVQVDAGVGLAEVRVRTLGQFQVVTGPLVPPADYLQPLGVVAPLEGGFTFLAEAVPIGLPFPPLLHERWRIAGPGVDDLIYIAGGQVGARESLVENWRETWFDPYPIQPIGIQTPRPQMITTTQVEAPIGSLPLGGLMRTTGSWAWSEPRIAAGRLYLDVVRLRLLLEWTRADIGVGQREYFFWFAAGTGLIGFAQDGVVRARTSP